MLCGLENMYSCAGRPPNSRIRTLHDSQTLGAHIEVYFTYVYTYVCIYIIYIYIYMRMYIFTIILDSVSV